MRALSAAKSRDDQRMKSGHRTVVFSPEAIPLLSAIGKVVPQNRATSRESRAATELWRFDMKRSAPERDQEKWSSGFPVKSRDQ